MASALPDVFGRRRWLGWLNVAGVALALSSVVGALFDFAELLVAPTLVVGAVWAALLRSPTSVFKGRVRLGWVLSVPLGALNAALIGALLFASEASSSSGWLARLQSAFLGGLLGATIGAIIWVPAVFATLLFFGVPIAYSQRLARRGLAGEERGERLVGIATALLGLVAPCRLLVTTLAPSAFRPVVSPVSSYVIASMGSAAFVLGLLSVYVATVRGRRRRTFVESVERGERPGYRVVDKEEGRVLVRVEPQGSAYRVADFEEVLVALDDDGAARTVVARARD